MEQHIRGLEAQIKKKEEFGDLLTVLLIKTLSGDLRRSLHRRHRKTTWTLNDFFPDFKRKLQVMEQDKIEEVNSMTNLQSHSTAPFYTDQTQNLKLQGRTGYGTKDYKGQKKPAGVFFQWIITWHQRWSNFK